MENSGIYARGILGIYVFVWSEQREIFSLNSNLLVYGMSKQCHAGYGFR